MALPAATFISSEVDTLVGRASTPQPSPGNVQIPISGSYSAPYVSAQGQATGTLALTQRPASATEDGGGPTPPNPLPTSGSSFDFKTVGILAAIAVAVWYFFLR